MATLDKVENRFNRKVRYVGDNRPGLNGLVGIVVAASEKNGSVGVCYPHFNKGIWSKYAAPDGGVWAASWAWELVEENEPLTSTKAADDILNPHLASIQAIDSEISRLTDRLAELRKTREVLNSL